MVFGQKAANNILPWLRMKFSQKFLIRKEFLSHPQNIRWRYTLEHSQNYAETFRSIMNLLGVDIPPLEGVVQLRFLMTKKRTLEMMECVEEFVDSEVLEAVQQRTEKVKIARMTNVEALRRKEMEEAATVAAAAAAVAAAVVAEVDARMKEMQEAATVAAAAAVGQWKEMKEAAAAAVVVAEAEGASVVVVAAMKRKALVEISGSQPSCVRLCNHVGCTRSVYIGGVCREHGPRCSHVGCTNDVHIRGVRSGHGRVVDGKKQKEGL